VSNFEEISDVEGCYANCLSYPECDTEQDQISACILASTCEDLFSEGICTDEIAAYGLCIEGAPPVEICLEEVRNAGRICSYAIEAFRADEAICNMATSFEECDNTTNANGEYVCQWEYDMNPEVLGLDPSCTIEDGDGLIHLESKDDSVDCSLPFNPEDIGCFCEDGTCQILFCTPEDLCAYFGPVPSNGPCDEIYDNLWACGALEEARSSWNSICVPAFNNNECAELTGSFYECVVSAGEDCMAATACLMDYGEDFYGCAQPFGPPE
jgi:hypothetical protein